MKKILIFFSLLVSVHVTAQTYPITSITISLPTNPDANTANWGSGTSLFTITANAKAVNGRVDGHVSESKILVTIKKGGAKVCGSFTANTAPASNFNTLTKVWSGSNAVSLLGQGCLLPSGEYELTVQFFGLGAAGLAPLSEEKIKPFSIRAKEQLSYQPPQAIAPANNTVLSEMDIKKPIIFRWTPVIPRPQEPVTYRLKVWQLMQGQNGAQAMATNQPIITKDVDNLTQTMITNLSSGPCLAPYLCDYIWNVQALNREGKPVGGNNGMSEALKFNVQTVSDAPLKIALVFPANGSAISAKDKPKFTWKHEKQNTESSNTYKLKIVEIIGNQSPEEALRTNKPHFEKDSLKEISFQYPISAPSFIAGKKYGWNVSIFDRWGKLQPSAASMFSANSCDVNFILKLQSVECLPDSGKHKRYKIGISATYTSAIHNLTYALSGSGLKAYHPSYTPNYSIANISPGLQVQNSGLTTTKTYFLEVSVPAGQTAIKLGLQGDDKDPGPIVCQPGAELDVQLPICKVVCDCGKWNPLAVQTTAGAKRYDCGSRILWSCKTPFQFTSSYQCSPNNESCQAKTSWEVRKGDVIIKSGIGTNTLSDGFSLLANGIYTLTLNANCGDKKCPPCIYTIVVEDCKDADPCKDVLLCNTDFEQFVNISPPTTFVQTSQDNIPCWKTTATDGNIEIWKSGFGGVLAYSLNYFAELNATQVGILSQTFTATGPITVSVSFAHRGRYAGDDKMQVSIVGPSPVNTSTLLGNYSANDTGWITNVTLPYTIPSTALGIYTLEFKSVSSNNGAGPSNGGNFLDSITVTCTEAPPVEVCDCGKWNPLTVQNAAGAKRYDCGSRILWSCKTPFQFTSSYQCSPNNESCQAKTSWEVRKGDVIIKSGIGTNTLSDGFSLLANGIYTLTLNANCGDKKCPPCIYTIVVEDCKDADPCKDVLLCNTDFEQFVNISPPTTFVQTSQDNIPCWKTTATDGNIEIWKSGFGGVLAYSLNYFAELNATQVGILSQTFTATGPITVSVSFAHRGRYAGDDKMQVSIVGPSPVNTSTLLGNYSANDTGWITNVTLPYTIPSTALGIYTLEFKSVSSNNGAGPSNGGNFLDAITVTCTEAPPVDVCDCGKWNPLVVQNAAGTKRYDCGNEIEGRCNQSFNFSSAYQCNPNNKDCQAKVNWTITKDGSPYSSGTGTTGAFTPTANGTYTITLEADCNGVKCPPCVYKIIVRDCVIIGGKCDCGKWNPLTVQNAAGAKRYDCGSRILWSCKTPFQFTSSYQCSPNNESCQAKTSWEVRKGDVIIKSGIGTNTLSDGFSLLANGIYTLTLNAVCNGKKCPPCIYTIVVTLSAGPCDSTSQEIIDLFIWAGQSNAQGWKGAANFYPSDPNNLDNSIRLNYTFIGTSSSNGWITMQPQIGLYPQGHFGAEVTFSRKLKQAGFNPAIFKYCKGATSLYGNWKAPGASGYYDNMVTALNAAITNLENQGHIVNVRGFIWIQGEGDGNPTYASAYEINLLNLINDIRNNVVNDSTLPIILGVDEQHPNMVAHPGVLNAHENIDENDDNLKFTSMYGLQKADVSHLTPAGLIIHGEQIFDTYTLLLSGQTPYSTCIISSTGNTVSSSERVSWGQSFKPSCSGLLSAISFNSATNIASSLTISISNGADCNATQLYTQSVNSITDGDNLVSISNQIYLDKEHTYYINITSDLGEVWKVRYNLTNQVIGNLRTSLNGGAGSTCGWNYSNFDLNFSVVITL